MIPLAVPFVSGMLREETRAAVAGRRGAFVELEGPEAYWRLLRLLWAAEGGFCLVEQDVVPHAGALEELDACGRPWCAFPYSIGDVTRACLGCCRFRPELPAAHPDLVDRIRDRRWRRVDLELEAQLAAVGYPGPHLHQPAVLHLRAATRSAISERVLQQQGRIAAARG